MTNEPPAGPDAGAKATNLFLAGVGLVMAGCLFGGGLALAFFLVGQKTGAVLAGAAGGLLVVIGIGLQVSASRKLKASRQVPRR